MGVPPLVCLRFLPGIFLSSRMTGACPVTTDLIKPVNARTTTTTISYAPPSLYTVHLEHMTREHPGTPTGRHSQRGGQVMLETDCTLHDFGHELLAHDYHDVVGGRDIS